MLKRLRLKFICINMAIVTVMLLAIFVTVFTLTRRNLENGSLQMMRSLASAPFQPGRPDEPPDEVRLPYFILQLTPHDELIATGGGYFDLSDEDFLRALFDAAAAEGGQSGVLREYGLRFCRADAPGGQRIVFADLSSEQATLRSLLQTCLLIAAVSLPAFWLISLLLARWTVRPVEAAWTQQKQFVADASHELKTPLTVILTNAELLQNPDCDEASRTQYSGSILAMSRQMRGLVEGMLELARVDSGAEAFSSVDLSALLSEAMLPFEPMFFERGLTLYSRFEPGVCVVGSAPHLRQVADILLDNALKYSTPDGPVQVGLTRQGTHALLAVSGCGDPISREDLKNIFRRFYRIDKARSMSPSYGLGLSIAERIVTRHRGRIWAASENGVNTFFVQLPL